MAYIGWATNVNQIIIDSTQISIGQNIEVQDSLVSGKVLTRLKNNFIPDSFQVTMDFDWVEKDIYGKTEKDRFYEWYKYVHKAGQNPFEFPKVILGAESTNRETAFYKITGGITGQKHGNLLRIQTTFTEVFSGSINISTLPADIDHITAYKDKVEVFMKFSPTTIPLTSDFSVSVKKSNVTVSTPIKRYEFDGNVTETIWFLNELKDTGTYTFSVTYKGKTRLDSLVITGE